MFDNIVGKIKAVAQVVTWLVIIASLLSSLALYGFGQLIENTDIIAGRSRINNTPEYVAKVFDKTQSSTNGIKTPTKLGTCELCDKKDVEVVNCKIVDSLGTRYRNICADCMLEHNATPTGK